MRWAPQVWQQANGYGSIEMKRKKKLNYEKSTHIEMEMEQRLHTIPLNV